MKVSYQNGVFRCRPTLGNRHILQAAWVWNSAARSFETKELWKAWRLREHFDDSAVLFFQTRSVYKTPDWWFETDCVPKGQKLLPFQIEGVEFALRRNNSYLAFEMGLGKTPTAIVLMNHIHQQTVIVCPTFLVDNWLRELKTWYFMTAGAIRNGREVSLDLPWNCVVVPDSLLDRSAVQDAVARFEPGLLIVDEAHRFKTVDAKRTKALVNKIKTESVGKTILLSGTPMPARPMELYPLLSAFAGNTIGFRTQHQYGLRYCGAFENEYGWVYTGATNQDELKKRIHGSFMLRKEKKDVLKQLPPKEERIVVVGRNTGVVKKKWKEYRPDQHNLGELAKYSSQVAIEKFPLALQYIENILEGGFEKPLLVFAWHTSFILSLRDALQSQGFKVEMIYGKTPMQNRTEIVNNFQAGKIDVLIGQVFTMVGLNLTAASRVIFAEFSWTPGDNDQAADRAHRIGQDETVVVDYLALADSLDEQMLESLLNKKRVIKKLINKEKENADYD